jgi:hypothetical protein
MHTIYLGFGTGFRRVGPFLDPNCKPIARPGQGKPQGTRSSGAGYEALRSSRTAHKEACAEQSSTIGSTVHCYAYFHTA